MFTKSKGIWQPHRPEQLDLAEVLPGQNFSMQAHPEIGIYMSPADPFTLPSRLYGDVVKHSARIINTFNDRPRSTGVLLSGEKGSGKTLLAKHVSISLAAKGVPTIIVNQPMCGPSFNDFIQSIKQPAVIFFDEFEKVYVKSEHQEALLTLLDGTFPTKKLFILTSNDTYRIDTHLRNRPGRVFYNLPFTGLSEQFIKEYCAENLQNPKHTLEVLGTSRMFAQFNFDMLAALVEDMNRYNESPKQVMALLNARPEFGSSTSWAVSFMYKGVQYRQGSKRLHTQTWTGNPFVAGDDHHNAIDIYFAVPVDHVNHSEYSTETEFDETSRYVTAEMAAYIPKDVHPFLTIASDEGEQDALYETVPSGMVKQKKAAAVEGTKTAWSHWTRRDVEFLAEDYCRYDEASDTFFFENSDKHQLALTRIRRAPYNAFAV